MTQPSRTTPHIPLPYRFLFLYFEPSAALFGAVITHLQPALYLDSLSPRTAQAGSTYSPLDQPIYDQLSAHLLRFAYCQAVLLRAFAHDLRVWRYILFGMLLCDLMHLYASYQILGAATFFDPRRWRFEEWVNFIMLYGPGAMRVGLCLGVGIRQDGGQELEGGVEKAALSRQKES